LGQQPFKPTLPSGVVNDFEQPKINSQVASAHMDNESGKMFNKQMPFDDLQITKQEDKESLDQDGPKETQCSNSEGTYIFSNVRFS
jgi:hypothetical protein